MILFPVAKFFGLAGLLQPMAVGLLAEVNEAETRWARMQRAVRTLEGYHSALIGVHYGEKYDEATREDLGELTFRAEVLAEVLDDEPVFYSALAKEFPMRSSSLKVCRGMGLNVDELADLRIVTPVGG